MLYINLNYFNFICMQDLNSFRIVGTIKNLIIQEEIENEVSVVDAGSTDIGDKSEWDILLSKKYKFGADAKKLIGDCRENLLIVDSKNRRGFPKYQLRFMIEFLGSDYKNIKTFKTIL